MLMGELQLILDLVAAVLAAFVGGVVAQRLGQPVILGYLIAGVAIRSLHPGTHGGRSLSAGAGRAGRGILDVRAGSGGLARGAAPARDA